MIDSEMSYIEFYVVVDRKTDTLDRKVTDIWKFSSPTLPLKSVYARMVKSNLIKVISIRRIDFQI